MKKHANSVDLIGYYGGDITHSCSAWTSTSRQLTAEKRARIPKLLRDLAEAGHETPFEKSALHFLITTDIATHIQLLKHRIGVSCVSGDTEIYVPRPGGGVDKRTIASLYETQEHGIFSVSARGRHYRRAYGRPIPIRTKADDSNEVRKGYIETVHFNGEREVYRFTTASGKQVTTTLDHQFLTPVGWRSIGEYLGVKLVGMTAVLSRDGAVATNGVVLDDPKRPWTSREFFTRFEHTHTRMETAELCGLSYELVKKWGYIHKVNFKSDENKDFKPGMTPWNKSVRGYKAPRAKRGINPNINKDLTPKIWRATVGNWTSEQLPKLLTKFGAICQAQYSVCSRDFVGHHVLPVSVAPERATDFENLVLVCRECHKAIHASRTEEQAFAERYRDQDLKTEFAARAPRKGRRLAYSYEEIEHVEYLGVQKVYDLTVNDTHCYVGNGFLLHNCNTESARYKELKEDKFYLPDDWSTHGDAKAAEWYKRLKDFNTQSNQLYHDCLADLTPILGRKRAKESARYFKPYSSQIQADVQFNFRSFVHFQRLRGALDSEQHAQLEIRQVALDMLNAVRAIRQNGACPFEHSLVAFGLDP